MDKKQQIIALWRICFEDTEAFIRLYFDHVYKDENTLVIEKNGRVVSALQMLPYTMTYFGTELSVAYISGACTLPSEQGQGLMKQLLYQAFDLMQKREIDITVLIPAHPWLFDFYRKQGYIEAFHYAETAFTFSGKRIQPQEKIIVQEAISMTDELYTYLNKKLRERPLCVLHTKDDLDINIRDIRESHGKIYTARNTNSRIVGLAFVSPTETDCNTNTPESLIVKEILYDMKEIRAYLLQEIAVQNNVSHLTTRHPSEGNTVCNGGMARLINREHIIRLWLSNHPLCIYTQNELEEMDIQSLTRLVMDCDNKTGFMSLMLD